METEIYKKDNNIVQSTWAYPRNTKVVIWKAINAITKLKEKRTKIIYLPQQKKAFE